MKKQITFALMLLISIVTSAQIKYEKGYFISNDDTKTECLIKTHKKNNFPSIVSYKFKKYEDPIILPIELVKEFEIYDNGRYERHQVKIDVSSQNLQTLSEQRNPEWETKILFLKVLVNNKTSLYKFENKEIRKKYFYKNDSSNLEQLVYKTYYTKKKNKGKNLTYLFQLNKYFNCNGETIDKSSKIKYDDTDLTEYFYNYNYCKNDINDSYATIYSNIIKNPKKFKFNLKVVSGLNSNSLEYRDDINNELPDYGSNFSPKFGVEAEIFFPISKEKWSFFIESTYQQYSDKDMLTTETAEVDIKYIQTSLGFRYYFYLNDKSALYSNLNYVFNNVMGDIIIWDDENRPSNPNGNINTYYPNNELTYSNTYAFGFGYSYKNKLNMELRQYADTNFSSYLDSKLRQFSIIFSYNFL